MSKQLLHEHAEFSNLIEIVAAEKAITPVLVEKDYWIMHALWGLTQQGLKLELKGGTSLSKGFDIIHRFSEDLDIKIEPNAADKVYSGKNHSDPKHIESRRTFFEGLAKKISIPGMRVTRDHEYDDKERARNVGIRLDYTSLFGDDVGLKTGVLLEVGFDTTQPSTACDISSWAFDRALGRIEIEDNRALKISCYHPGYTFVEKLHAVIRKFQRYRRGEGLPRNFLRHYYDLYQLLEHPQVKAFVGTPKYHEHKKVRFGSIDHDISKSEAFKLSAPDEFAEFEKQYKATAILYFKGQPALRTILDRLQANVANL